MDVVASDHWIPTGQGDLFARTWQPAHVDDGGRATILLFHDSLGSVELWRDFPERLGFGRSAPHPGRLALDFVRDEARGMVPRVCDALGIERMVAFGHSVGGGMAVATAAHLGERCEAVVTESAQSFVEDRTLAGIRDARADFAKPGRVERLARWHGDKLRWVLDAWIETWLHPAFAGWCLDDELQEVRCPLFALHGDTDEYGSVEHARRIVRLTSNPARAVILERCGHVPHREQPARVLDEVARFLA